MIPAEELDAMMHLYNSSMISEADTERLFVWLRLYAESKLQKLKVRIQPEDKEEIAGDALLDALRVLTERNTAKMQSPMAYVCRSIDTRINKAVDRVIRTNSREAELVSLANEQRAQHGIEGDG